MLTAPNGLARMSDTPASDDAPDKIGPEARLAVEQAEGVTVARFPLGRTDGIAVREFFEAAMLLSRSPRPRMLVDFTGVALVTSGMMGMLVQVHKRLMQAGGRLAVAIPDERARGAFEMARLDRLLTIEADVASARRSLTG